MLRLSGPNAGGAANALMRSVPAPRHAAVRTLRDGSGSTLDSALVIWMPGPGSYTGEDMLELHLHGGRAVLSSVLEELSKVSGCRPAEPGEFTRRALLSGRMDATEAEAVADLVDADTDAQRRQAIRQLGGAVTAEAERWRSVLIQSLAHIEAYIDFPDEEIPSGVVKNVRSALLTTLAEMNARLGDRRGAIIRDGFRVAITGRPNVGKSTLLNALAGRDVAIVTGIPGTTRDVLEVSLDLSGYSVIVADTAGIRETEDPVELEGVRRAERWSQEADIRLILYTEGVTPAAEPAAGDIPVLTQTDRLHAEEIATALADHPSGVSISAQTGDGMAALLERIEQALAECLSGVSDPILTRERHRSAVSSAAAALERFSEWNGGPDEIELAAEDLRLAVYEIGRLTGRVNVDDLLDVIFRDFCLGK